MVVVLTAKRYARQDYHDFAKDFGGRVVNRQLGDQPAHQS